MVIVNFDKQLYTLEAVEQAAQVYQDWADFDIKEDKEGVKVSIKADDEEEVIRDEFGNYVLALMKNY